MKKGFILGLIIGIVITGLSVALASSQIQAILNDQIKVSFDGQVQEFRDETTNEVQYPITYKDRTYLPLRTVANLVGVGVDYDATTNTAILIKNGVPKSEQTGTAGSNIPLKDNHDEAEYQIKVAVQNLFKEVYGDKVFDARINVDKIYTSEEEEKMEVLKEMKLGPNEVAFEISYDLKPAEGADVMELTIPNGEYDEESGWVKDCSRLGVLRPTDKGEAKYIITDYGTGW